MNDDTSFFNTKSKQPNGHFHITDRWIGTCYHEDLLTDSVVDFDVSKDAGNNYIVLKLRAPW